MNKLVLAAAILSYVWGCTQTEQPQREVRELSSGTALLLSDSYGYLVVEATSPDNLTMRSSKQVTQCLATDSIRQSWSILQEMCAGEGFVSSGWMFDPNDEIDGVGIAFAEPLPEGGYRIRPLVDSEKLKQAADEIDGLFQECGVDRRLQLTT